MTFENRIAKMMYQLLTMEYWEKYYWDDTRWCSICGFITPWSKNKCAICEPPEI